jgi:hypothetical protein
MSEWQFWQDQLAGREPDVTPGTPHQGYFVAKEYVAIPGGAKRVLTDMPVAIWFENDHWTAAIHRPTKDYSLYKTDEVDELFARCCRNAIRYDEYLRQVHQIHAWRSGKENWKDAA